MKTKKNTTLAFDILKRQKRHTLFWFAAFIVAFSVVVIDRITTGMEQDK